jgi:hypothetical protein
VQYFLKEGFESDITTAVEVRDSKQAELVAFVEEAISDGENLRKTWAALETIRSAREHEIAALINSAQIAAGYFGALDPADGGDREEYMAYLALLAALKPFEKRLNE